MAIYAKDIVKQAENWIGCKESNGSYKKILDVYNGHKPLARGYKMGIGDAWCAAFVSAVAIKCGATKIIPTECSCNKMIALFKELGSWVENENRTPAPGDILFYDWQDNGKGDNKGTSDHVGIVQKVSGKNIYVIEGNYSNAVKVRKIKVNGKNIRGYGVPKYDKEVVAKKEEPAKKTLEQIADEVILGKWGNGAERKKRLKAAGYDAAAVQKIVNKKLLGK